MFAAITDGMKNPGEVMLLTTTLIVWVVGNFVYAFVKELLHGNW